MDPFEARLQFLKMLTTLQPVSLLLMRCVTFALRNHEYQDDFHSCILESLENSDLNTRLNILNFVDSLVVQSKKLFAKAQNKPYIENIVKGLPEIMAKVTPADEYGLYNLTTSKDLLLNLSRLLGLEEEKLEEYKKRFTSNLLTDKEYEEAQNCVENNKSDEMISQKFQQILDHKENSAIQGAWEVLLGRKRVSQFITLVKSRENYDSSESFQTPVEKSRFDKKQLTKEQKLARMEADRERHKKAKESLWIVERPGSGRVDKEEFMNLWERCGPITDEHLKELTELKEIADRSLNYKTD